MATKVKQGVTQIVHQYSVDRYGHLPAVAQKKHIHQYGGDAAGYVVEKVRASAGDDPLEHPGLA